MSQSSASLLAATRSPNDIRTEIMALVDEYTSLVHARKPFAPGRSDVAVAAAFSIHATSKRWSIRRSISG